MIDPVASRVGPFDFRLIGPFRGGRVVAVAADSRDRQTFYFGSTGGGVWKTTDAGVYWENLSDPYFRRASVGALEVATADPNVLYAGMGECCIRGNVSHGDGVWRSMDAGRTWQHRGLVASRNIGRVRVDPHDPNIVMVAALGHAHGPNVERGVFRTTDGGSSWDRVLYRGPQAGAVDLSIDALNPRVVYATTWEAVRTPWGMSSGGPGSGLARSVDAGMTWEEISRRPGLPDGVLGRIGVSASAARAGRVWAVIEAASGGGLYRSDDYGDNWQRMADDPRLTQRAWYYQHVFAHPTHADTVFVLNVDPWQSTDGGRSFSAMSIPHGDHHDLWIDPSDPSRMIEGNDFGATVTLNAGESWSRVDNQPTAEIYHVTTDNRVPYRVYGAQQDTTTISVPSRSALAAITSAEWYAVGGGESGYVAVNREDPEVVYAGNYQGILTRYDHRTGQTQNIQVWPEATMGESAGVVRHRFQWTYPILASKHHPNVLYVGGNRVFKTVDEGLTWDPVSPDLTRADAERMGPSGGPITGDNTGAEYYCTVFSLAESPIRGSIIWAGSDDGLVHVTQDGGGTWRNVTPPLPEWATVTSISASNHIAGRAYVSATAYKLDDFRPYIFVTDDFGQQWNVISRTLPADEFVRVVREDPVNASVLFSGTEAGIYTSLDRGATWHRMMGLPAVPVHDLKVKDSDLVVATHGRSFWILDDISFLRESVLHENEPRLFQPRPTIRYRSDQGYPRAARQSKNYRVINHTMTTFRLEDGPMGDKRRRYLDAGANPPDGAIINYWLPNEWDDEVALTISDDRGRVVRSFRSDDTLTPRPPKMAGFNRFIWDLRTFGVIPVQDRAPIDERGLAGPMVPPGRYRVRLRTGSHRFEAAFDVVADPRISQDRQSYIRQYDFLITVRDRISELNRALTAIRAARAQVDGAESSAASPNARRLARNIRRTLETVEQALTQTRARTRQELLNYPGKLDVKLGGLAAAAGQADQEPTQGMRSVLADLSGQLEAQLSALQTLFAEQVLRFNEMARRADPGPITATYPMGSIGSDRALRRATRPRRRRSG